jgi:hypothetical protein
MRWATSLSASSKKQGDWIVLFSSCILFTLTFAAGRQTCRPSRAKLGLKDWANATQHSARIYFVRRDNCETVAAQTDRPPIRRNATTDVNKKSPFLV